MSETPIESKFPDKCPCGKSWTVLDTGTGNKFCSSILSDKPEIKDSCPIMFMDKDGTIIYKNGIIPTENLK